MRFYLAILLRTLAALAATVALIVGVGLVLETADPVWLPVAVVGLVLAFALWRAGQNLYARHVESQEAPFSL
jgi:hypothetical protein